MTRSTAVRVAALAICLASIRPAGLAAEKRALLIGIDRYAAVTALKGCVNDVEDMKRLLESKYGFKTSQVTVLRDQEASRAGILRAIAALTDRVVEGDGDIVVIHYSGHGSRMRDVSNDELDRWDETIVPQDSRQGGVFDISDDELNVLLRQLAAKTPHVTVILDSCHSGSATRGGTQARRVPDDTRIPPAPSQPPGSAPPESRTTEIASENASYTLIAGCRPMELSNEFEVGGQRRGALTYFLTSELRKARSGATFRDLQDRLLANVTALFPSQHPQIEGPREDAVVFGDVVVESAPYYLVRTSTQPITIDGGAIDGLTSGAALAVYPEGTKSFLPGREVAEIELVSVTHFSSTAKAVGTRSVPDFGRAVLRKSGPRSFELNVYLEKPESSSTIRNVRTLLLQESGIRSVSDQTSAHLIVRQDQGSIRLLHRDLSERSPRVPVGAAAADMVVNHLRQWRKWFALADLNNRNVPVPVKLSIRVGGAELPEADAEVTDRDRATFAVTNISDRPIYFALLDLSSDGAVTALYPRHDEEEVLAPGKTWEETFRMAAIAGAAVSEDLFKVITGEEPIPVKRYLQGAVRPAEPETPSQWSTTQRSVRVRRPVRVTGFIIHDPAPPAATGSRAVRAGDTIGDCSQPQGCYEIREFAPGNLVEAVPGGRGDVRVVEALGPIWDEAYRLKLETRAAAVEPSLDVDLSEWEQDDLPPSTRSSGPEIPKPGAVSDNNWSLKHGNVFKAWQLLQAGGRADGQEGASVIVAHLDTGYRKHPELWHADETKSTVIPSKGYDFLDQDDDPTDELDTSGLVPNPGHGTKSGSVIGGPKGAQYVSTEGKHAAAVAPAARLIPVRVHRSVVHVNSTRLGRAIFEAAGADRTRVKLPSQVISISMGGLPSWTLWKAVRYARQKGDIVVSAAGNHVGFVVWPARFDETIAVAATNVECGLWSGSSRGEAVDIAAPGESVWHAEVDAAGENLVQMGSGTTYATANVAGIAALWLDHHRANPLLRRLQQDGEVTDAFRSALRAAAWIPPATSVPQDVRCSDTSPWNSRMTGAGIVDAAKTLAQPLVRPAGTRGLDSSPLPLFQSLFPQSTSSEEIESRFRRLLLVGPEKQTEEVSDLEAEIVQNYALHETVRASLDGVTQSVTVSDEQYQAARNALLQVSISNRLRRALTGTN